MHHMIIIAAQLIEMPLVLKNHLKACVYTCDHARIMHMSLLYIFGEQDWSSLWLLTTYMYTGLLPRIYISRSSTTDLLYTALLYTALARARAIGSTQLHLDVHHGIAQLQADSTNLFNMHDGWHRCTNLGDPGRMAC